MPSSVIQWFPGHMAKTKRLITECLPLVDIVIEVLDARIPVSSKNPVLDSLLGEKPRLAVFSKSALADPEASRLWQAYYRGKGTETIFYDCRSGDNLNAIAPKVREILGEKLERYESKGMTGRKLKAMIVGIPNVGKSSLDKRPRRLKPREGREPPRRHPDKAVDHDKGRHRPARYARSSLA